MKLPRTGTYDKKVDEAESKATGGTEEMPPAVEHPGKIIRDTKTNKRYKSNGIKWVEIK